MNASRVLPLLACLLLASSLMAQTPRQPVLLDTDLGTDIDDAFALGLVLASPELDLRGVTTVGKDTNVRALMLCRFLTMTGRRNVQVAAGDGAQPDRPIKEQYQYYYHPDVLFNRTTRPQKQTAVDFLYSRVKGQPGKVTILATGPLTNVAKLITDKGDSKSLIRRIILREANVAADKKAAQAVFASGVPLVVVPESVASKLKLSTADVKRVFEPDTALSQQVRALYQLWDRESPPLGDVLAAALCFEERFCSFKDEDRQRLVTAVKADEFVKWYVERMANCVRPADRPVKPVARGGMPHRVHVAEDFDTDIERRWWMAGKAETKDLPSGSKRAVRGVLTHDFDDLLGNPKAMHTAVVFNPVPGPPMGKNTRLWFRYKLQGDETLRVQIYSLSNGYHRHLVLTGLPQGKWQEATVDMTQARRPDGTGGPLSEGERIDDIQFYTGTKAELLIDDVVLYDAAAAGEKRPFPKRAHFTGWFDSGRQGKEWPGDFEIVRDRGFYWHAARSVENKALGAPWIRLHLRGERPLGDVTHLRFRYHLTGGETMRVRLVNSTTKADRTVELKGLMQGKWAEVTADLGATKGQSADEVHFLPPKGAELLVDDVLLFEPGE